MAAKGSFLLRRRTKKLLEFAFETHGKSLATTAKIACNKATYLLQRAARRSSTPALVHTRWHWSKYPFSLRKRVLWSSALRAWFVPEDESAIECMLHMRAYEPVEWVTPQPGEYFLDVGGYVGWYSIQAARAVGEKGRVVVLEPDALNRLQLQRNVALNGIDNVQILPFAAWCMSTRVGWHCGAEPVWHRVTENREHTREAVYIDDLVFKLRLPRLDWIKLDIEGGEVQALRGGTRTLASLRPKLFIEIHETRQQVDDLLKSMNFRIEKEAYDEPGFKHGWILVGSAH